MADDDHLIPPPEPEHPEDLGEPKDVRKRRVAARQEELDHQAYTISIMSSKIGRRWMWDLLGWCKVGHNPFSTNQLIMAHNCGELNVGNRLIAEISESCPQQYVAMLMENSNASRTKPANADTAGSRPVEPAAGQASRSEAD